MMRKITFFLAIMSFFGMRGQTWEQMNKITPSDRNTDDYFGFRVIIEDNIIFSGAYQNDYDSNGSSFKNNAGSVYVFTSENDEWTQESKLVANDRQSYDQFGREMEFVDNTLFVTARRRAVGSMYYVGAVYIFDQDDSGNWIENQILVPNIPTQNAYFGNKIGVKENILAVGSQMGNVNVFEYNPTLDSWEFQQELAASNGNTNNADVAVNAGKIVVGKRDQQLNALNDVGQVYIYEENPAINEWEIVQTINPPSIQENLEFGASIFVHNDFLFVQSPNLNQLFVYELNPSTDLYELSQEISGGTGFGVDVSIEENTMVVGAYQANAGATFGGAIYMYELQNGVWENITEISNNDPDSYDWFGSGVDIDNGIVVVGAPYEDLDSEGNNNEAKAGAFYIFEDTSSLSIHDVNDQISVTTYPNPFTQSLSIALEKGCQNIKINLYDSFGKEIFVNHYTNTNRIHLNLPSLTSGIYLLQIYSGNNLLKTEKLIKK